jgi:hypothetical protein
MNNPFFSKITDGVAEPALPAYRALADSGCATVEELVAAGFVQVEQPPYPTTGKRYQPGVPTQVDDVYVGVWDEQEVSVGELRRLAFEMKTARNQMLKNCDWTQAEDAPVDRAAWAAYRQALRDVPEQEGFPSLVQWPQQPE